MLKDLATAKPNPGGALPRDQEPPCRRQAAVWLLTDKPSDDPQVTGKPVRATMPVLPLDSLVYHAEYLKAIESSPCDGRKLGGARNYLGR